MSLTSQEKSKLFHSFLFPALFVFVLWLIKSCEFVFDLENLYRWGIYPRETGGLRGILFSPLLHGDWEHLFSNTIPVFVLSSLLFYFYRPLSYRIFFLIYLISGFWIWVFARPSFHIGASGLIYGLSMFLFTSGVFRKDLRLLGVSALVLFLYGSIFMGMFPFIKREVSWESHLLGALAGLMLAFYYRKEGPQRPVYPWEHEMEEEEEPADNSKYDELLNDESGNPDDVPPSKENFKDSAISNFTIHYHYRKNPEDKN